MLLLSFHKKKCTHGRKVVWIYLKRKKKMFHVTIINDFRHFGNDLQYKCFFFFSINVTSSFSFALAERLTAIFIFLLHSFQSQNVGSMELNRGNEKKITTKCYNVVKCKAGDAWRIFLIFRSFHKSHSRTCVPSWCWRNESLLIESPSRIHLNSLLKMELKKNIFH